MEIIKIKNCALCDGEIEGQFKKKIFNVNGKNVEFAIPVMVCKNCGMEYISPETSRRIDEEIEKMKEK